MQERRTSPRQIRSGGPPTRAGTEALWELVSATAGVTGDAFFRELTRNLASALGMQYAFVTEGSPDRPSSLRVVASWVGDGWGEAHVYSMDHTPCEQVFKSGRVCCYPSGVQQAFPEDQDLVEMGAESYLGAPLKGVSGRVVGHVCVLDQKPLPDERWARSVLNVFAVRAAAELDRQRTERALLESEERYRIVAETASDAIITVDRDSKIVYANPSALTVFGYSREELLGQPVTRLMPEPWTGRELIARHKSGREIPVEVSFAELSEDTVNRFTVMIRDVSERKEAEQRQRQSQNRLRRQSAALVALAHSDELRRCDFGAFNRLATETASHTLDVERVGVWFFNADRSILRLVDLYARSTGQHSEGVELQAASYPRYFAALGAGRAVAAHDARRDSATREFSEAYLAPLGISSMLDAPLRHRGELIGVVCHEHVGPARVWTAEEQEFAASLADFVSLALESSERQRAEAELLEQQHHERQRVEAELAKVRDQLVLQTRLGAIGQVAASIAHELRNPLGAIRNAGYYLRRHLPRSQAKWREHLQIIEEEVHTADRIINSLMEMSRAKQPTKTRVDLAEVADDALCRVDGGELVRLRLDLAPDPFPLQADADQLRQVLGNLLLNSTQANQRRQEILLQARREGDVAVITLTDGGPGVPEEIRERIFEPLFTTKAKGTGLGLALCRQIVERHGGTIELAVTEGPGTTFRIRLPGQRGE